MQTLEKLQLFLYTSVTQGLKAGFFNNKSLMLLKLEIWASMSCILGFVTDSMI